MVLLSYPVDTTIKMADSTHGPADRENEWQRGGGGRGEERQFQTGYSFHICMFYRPLIAGKNNMHMYIC